MSVMEQIQMKAVQYDYIFFQGILQIASLNFRVLLIIYENTVLDYSIYQIKNFNQIFLKAKKKKDEEIER